MATEDELRAAREAHAKNELGDERNTWFPNWLTATSEQEQLREQLVGWAEAAKADPSVLVDWPEEADIAEDATTYPLWGRVMAKRGPFVVIQTPHGRAQAYFSKDVQKAGLKGTLKRTDLGDHIWVEGQRFRTGKGDVALRCAVLRHVSKAMLPPPEKWHGLKDVEKRYRERYVDLFANQAEVATVFRARGAIVSALRKFHDDRGYLEVETPTLHSVRGGATAKPFSTHHNALDMQLYLRIAPELYLKRLVVGGLDRVYEIGRQFRNEGISTRHNPEFTMLECYTAYATYEYLLDFMEELFREVDRAVLTRWPAFGDGRAFSLQDAFARVPMRRAVADRLERSGKDGIPETPWADVLDEAAVYDPDKLDAACATMVDRADRVERKQLMACENAGERLFLLYELLAEPELTAMYRSSDGSKSVPVLITEYPFEVSPLARRNDKDPRFTDRFELFVDGREICNGFSELNDPEDQADRFRAQVDKAARGAEETMDYDADYIRALSYGMPNAAGYGLGVDRLVMLLCNQPSIRDVLLFPTLRPEAG